MKTKCLPRPRIGTVHSAELKHILGLNWEGGPLVTMLAEKMTRLFFLIFYNINCLEFLPGKFFHLFLAFSYDKALKLHLEANVSLWPQMGFHLP